MKRKLFYFALTLVFLSQAAFAQRNRDTDRDRSQNYYDNTINDEDNAATYGPRRLRYDPGHDCQVAMSPRAFRQALYAIRNESFDQDKVKMARFIAKRNRLSTTQIRAIAQSFSFDGSKLEFVKYAYIRCVDPENYYALGRIFTFSSNRQELYDYMARV